MTDKNDFQLVPMSTKRRDFYFKIIDNVHNFHPITWRLHYLESHFPQEKLDTALGWLTHNGIVGTKFVTWFNEECSKSDLEMIRLLLSIVDNLQQGRIIAGKDFRL